MSWTHEYSWRLEASPERVFKALTDSDELSRWFAEQTDLAIEPGGRYRFWGKHTLGAPAIADSKQVITRLEPGSALGFTWNIHGVPRCAEIQCPAPGAAGDGQVEEGRHAAGIRHHAGRPVQGAPAGGDHRRHGMAQLADRVARGVAELEHRLQGERDPARGRGRGLPGDRELRGRAERAGQIILFAGRKETDEDKR